MITSLMGLPGSGKSYAATVLALDELRSTERFIVTNLPLRLDNIIKLFVAEGRGDIDVYGRVQFLEHDQVTDYWRYRGPGVEPLPAISPKEQKDGKVPEIEWFMDKRAVAYFLDEWHEHCNSRTWQRNGEINFWYAAKHRHWGDDLTWISQSPANVDKQFRSITAEYVRCRNFGYEAFKGFRKGSHLVRETFLGPELPTDGSTVQKSEKFHINVKTVGQCYYTSLAKGDADTKRKPKGFHIIWLYVGIIAAGFVAWLALTHVPNILQWYLHVGPKALKEDNDKIRAATANHLQEQPSAKPVNERQSGGSRSLTPVVPQVQQAMPESTPKPVFIIGVPLKNVTADEAIQALNGNGGVNAVGSTGASVSGANAGITAVRNASNDAVLVSGGTLQQVSAYAEILRQYDQQAQLITVNAVVGRLVHGKSEHVGLYDLLRASAATQGAGGELSALLTSLTYNVATGVATFGSAIAARELLTVLTDFEARGYRFEVVSRPTITTLSGRSGTFGTGREIPLPETVSDSAGTRTSVQYKNADFSFTIKPTLKPDGTVRLEIDQKNSDVLSSAEIGGNPVPTLSTQNLATIIDLSPTQVAYLGGIKVRTKNRERRGVPVLKDIPVVNLLFGSTDSGEEESELVVLVSVDLHHPGDSPVRVMRATPAHIPQPSQWQQDTETLPYGTGRVKSP